MRSLLHSHTTLSSTRSGQEFSADSQRGDLPDPKECLQLSKRKIIRLRSKGDQLTQHRVT